MEPSDIAHISAYVTSREHMAGYMRARTNSDRHRAGSKPDPADRLGSHAQSSSRVEVLAAQ